MTKEENKEQKPIIVNYSLNRIVTGRFSFQLPSKKEDTVNLNLNYTVEPFITSKIEEEKVFIKLSISASIINSQTNVIEIETIFEFTVKDLKNFITVNGDVNEFDSPYQPVIASMLAISISTSRGIIFEKTKGTIYDSKLLPIIDPNVFFKRIEQSEKTNGI